MKNLMSYIEEFEQIGIIQDNAIKTGEFKKANATLKKLQKILEIAKNDTQKEEFYSRVLSTSKSDCAIINACSHMLKLNIEVETAIERLEEISSSRDKSMSRMSARMLLQEWENGNIKPIE